MSKYLLTLVLFFFGANGFADESSPFNLKENHPLKNIPVREMPIIERVRLYDDIKGIEDSISHLAKKYQDREIFCRLVGFTEEEIAHLKDVHDIYEQVHLEVTMLKVREKTVTTKTSKTTKVIENQKYLYEVGYEFKMQEAANGNLESYVVKDRQSLWGKAVYLVKNPHEEDIMMQETQITNWKREE